ncbi:MAG: arylsulfotransferase family protein [Planctomycetes bacterium]|nr:arylsulfotransferase family protein [Planctomycetota bacterium]
MNSAPSSCQRLPNGNTLICLMNKNQAIEVDPSGEIVWEYSAKDGLRVGRVSRR